MLSRPKGSYAVMAQRHSPIDSLDFFCTPPWATRALFEHVIGSQSSSGVWEPAAGAGHMAEVLREYFATVYASDIHDYGCGYAIGSFVGEGADVVLCPDGARTQWIITNPPFTLAVEFARRALDIATRGVALLVRTAWLEGGERYRTLFDVHPPSTVALFVERVPMVKGRWDPKASTATSYSWVVWYHGGMAGIHPSLVWIPPGCRQALTKSTDVERFAS